jgi:hypothetical protein
VSLKKPVKLTIECDDEHKKQLEKLKMDLCSTANADEFGFGKGDIALENHENVKVSIELVESKE